MTKRIYSTDPEQNAELAAEHAFEARLLGSSVDAYWASADGDEYGDEGWDETMEYRVDLHPVLDSDAMITVFVGAEDEDHAVAQALDLYEGARVIAVVNMG